MVAHGEIYQQITSQLLDLNKRFTFSINDGPFLSLSAKYSWTSLGVTINWELSLPADGKHVLILADKSEFVVNLRLVKVGDADADAGNSEEVSDNSLKVDFVLRPINCNEDDVCAFIVQVLSRRGVTVNKIVTAEEIEEEEVAEQILEEAVQVVFESVDAQVADDIPEEQIQEVPCATPSPVSADANLPSFLSQIHGGSAAVLFNVVEETVEEEVEIIVPSGTGSPVVVVEPVPAGPLPINKDSVRLAVAQFHRMVSSICHPVIIVTGVPESSSTTDVDLIEQSCFAVDDILHLVDTQAINSAFECCLYPLKMTATDSQTVTIQTGNRFIKLNYPDQFAFSGTWQRCRSDTSVFKLTRIRCHHNESGPVVGYLRELNDKITKSYLAHKRMMKRNPVTTCAATMRPTVGVTTKPTLAPIPAATTMPTTFGTVAATYLPM
jgi:hypothetical protein